MEPQQQVGAACIRHCTCGLATVQRLGVLRVQWHALLQRCCVSLALRLARRVHAAARNCLLAVTECEAHHVGAQQQVGAVCCNIVVVTA
jgi:hypothetical protein